MDFMAGWFAGIMVSHLYENRHEYLWMLVGADDDDNRQLDMFEGGE